MIKTVDPRSLSRGQQRALQAGAAEFDEVAEEVAAEMYGYETVPGDPDFFDVRHPERVTKAEVKSTQTSIGEKYPAEGRFRVWEGQTRSLVASDARATAWYIFVLFDESAGMLRLRRMRPSTVSRIVDERGGWNESGHESMGRQHKIPIIEVFEV
jgi:hypothetical protein